MKLLIAPALLLVLLAPSLQATAEDATPPSQTNQTAQPSPELNGGNKINYDDPNLAMGNGYVSEMPITCSDASGKKAVSLEDCVRPASMELASDLPITNALYLVETVNAQTSVLTTPPSLLPSAQSLETSPDSKDPKTSK